MKNWKIIASKLCSRKLWVSIASFVTGLIVLNGGKQDFADKVGGAIIAGAAVVAYCVGEGLADSCTKIYDEKETKGDDVDKL